MTSGPPRMLCKRKRNCLMSVREGVRIVPGFVSTIVKLALVCLFVGFLLAFFDIDPVALMHNFPDAIQSVFEVVADLIRWAVPYVLLGAVVVVPIWLVFFLLRVARGRKSGS